MLRLTDLTILQVSDNTQVFFGEPPAALLGQRVARVVGAERQTYLQNMLLRESLERNVLYAFTLAEGRGEAGLDVCIHTLDSVAVLEFEPTGRQADRAECDYFSLLRSTVGCLQAATGLRDFCGRVAAEVRGMSGLDRVMVYRFHTDQHGEVFAESKRDDLPARLGLHHPATDISQPAREIFKKLWVRPLQDAAGPLVELVPLANPDTGRPLDMTHCALRAASVMCTEYLANMGVAATLVMPILVDGELWGLIVRPPVRAHPLWPPAARRLRADRPSGFAPAQIHRLHCAAGLPAQGGRCSPATCRQGRPGRRPDGVFQQPADLARCNAGRGRGAFSHGPMVVCVGRTPNDVQLDALVQWLNQRAELALRARPVCATDSLSRDYPAGASIANVASGVLAVRVSRLRQNLILWFRPETIQTVNWAGDPNDKIVDAGIHGARLTPRGSFELFVESVKARALPWTGMEIESALRLLVMEPVVARAERLAELNVDLTTSNEELDAFAYVASHDLKEPLRGIHRYAHQLLDSAQGLDPENRQRAESVMRLTLRMDGLLDSLLHFSRVGRTNLAFEDVNLNGVVSDALEMVGVRAADNRCTIALVRPLPVAHCNEVRVREIFSNLISNALKYTRCERPRIGIGYLLPEEPGLPANAPPEASGQTVYFVQGDGIGIESGISKKCSACSSGSMARTILAASAAPFISPCLLQPLPRHERKAACPGGRGQRRRF